MFCLTHFQNLQTHTHVSPLLCKLHWIPIAQRIDYKISSSCYDVSDAVRCTCLISFAFTFLPVHCVSLLTPASLGFQNERKSSKGSMLSSVSALSLGINSPTLYAMLKHSPTSKLSKKAYYSAQSRNQTFRTSFCIQLLILLFPL